MQKIFLFILTLLLVPSCKLGTVGAWKNGNIDKDQREQMKELNNQLFNAMITGNTNAVKSLMSEKLIAKGGDIDKLLKQIGHSFESDSYRILDEYHVRNTTTGVGNTIPSGTSKDNDYMIHYQAINKEMYISLLIPNKLVNELLITVIYGKYGSHWKINILQFGQYSLYGKTAPDYYKLAKERYHKSYLIDAVNYLESAKRCLKPANDFFIYQQEKEITAFCDQVINEANLKYTLPLTLFQIDSNPQIFRIAPEQIDEGIFPMVYYLTAINLKDTASLSVENKKIRKEIGKIVKGIDQDKEYVFYKAFNEMPIGQNIVECFGFVDHIK